MSVPRRRGGAALQALPRAPHVPRVAIDQLVISREQWNSSAPAFRALVEDTGGERDPVRRVVTWAKRLGLPRHVFGTVPHEPQAVLCRHG